MQGVRKTQIALTAAFVLLIFGVGLTQAAIELARSERPQFTDLFSQAPTERNLRTFEKNLEDESWFAQKARPLLQFAHFVLFRDAGEKVVLGRDGWLFYKPGMRYLIEPWPAKPRGLAGGGASPLSAFVEAFFPFPLREPFFPLPLPLCELFFPPGPRSMKLGPSAVGFEGLR